MPFIQFLSTGRNSLIWSGYRTNDHFSGIDTSMCIWVVLKRNFSLVYLKFSLAIQYFLWGLINITDKRHHIKIGSNISGKKNHIEISNTCDLLRLSFQLRYIIRRKCILYDTTIKSKCSFLNEIYIFSGFLSRMKVLNFRFD